MELAELERLVLRQQARDDIANLMGRYQYLHTGGEMSRIGRELFAWELPDATSEYGPLGVFGPEKSLEFFDVMSEQFTANGPECLPGLLEIHQITTPVIEVAEDLKTAKGLWMSTGAILMQDDPMDPTGSSFTWDTGKYAVDFINLNGTWKIWHLHVCDMWRTSFTEDPVKCAGSKEYGVTQEQIDQWNAQAAHGEVVRPHGFPIPDAPTTFHYIYAKDSVAPREPLAPQPYKTF
jgi:hypothetical protein